MNKRTKPNSAVNALCMTKIRELYIYSVVVLDSGAKGRKYCGTIVFINQNDFSSCHSVFHQNSNTPKLRHLFIFLFKADWLVSAYRSFHWKHFFTEIWFLTEHTLDALCRKCAWNVLVFKENHVKIKKAGCIHVYCYIIEICNW